MIQLRNENSPNPTLSSETTSNPSREENVTFSGR